jgi:predicted transcriptional regulator
MLETLFGNKTTERVLLYLENYEEGSGKRIADTFSLPLNAVQNQLRKLEEGGVLPKQRTSQRFKRTLL